MSNTLSSLQTIPVSVVIPVRDEASSMPTLLQAIFEQSPQPQQVIVVDAGSTDGTRDIVRAWMARWSAVSLIEVPQAYPGVGRNLGSEAAQTDWIVYIDGGTRPHANWLLALWQGVQGQNVAAGYGFYRPDLSTRVARWFALAVLPGARPIAAGLMRNHFIACSIVRKSAWEHVGGFPPWRAAEDRLFMRDVDAMGYVEVPESTIDWSGPQTWRQVWRRTALLAEHGARAGRARDWHWPTLRYWLIAAVIVAALPNQASALLLSGAWLVRAGRRIRRHRFEPGLDRTSPLDWIGAALILIVVDLAMYVGWWRGLTTRDAQLTASAH